MSQKAFISNLLEHAEITVNGPNPWDPQVHDQRLWNRIFAEGTLGLGEAYMEGWWDCADLAEFFSRVIRANIQNKLRITPNLIWQLVQARILNMQTIGLSRRVAEMHYSQTDAYKASLDSRMTGSCGYWPEGVTNVDQAQEAKFDMICRKIQLQQGERIWDIGCGWGAFMGFAAEKYGASCVGVTVSPDQAAYGRERYKDLDVEFQVRDYREFDQKVDKIVSMGMFEHVGYKNYATYFKTARRAIKDDGLFLLHTIGSPDTKTTIDPWIEKYIFPGGVLPSIAQIGKAIEHQFVIVDLHNIGPHYDYTLMAWNENFQKNWPEPQTPDEKRFKRMWEYYLLCCAGTFRSRASQVWQFVLAPLGVPEGYQTAR